MTEIRDWSITASANTGNAVDGFFKEGMAYSDVNDAARETQAILARADKDRNGTIVTTGSTGSYIVAINANLSSYADGDTVAFQAHAKNDGATTLRLRMPDGESLSDRPVVKTNLAALEDGDIAAGGTYTAFYKSASANWQLHGVPRLPDSQPPVTSAYKPSDESKTSDDTLAADADLSALSMEAGGVYTLECCLFFDCIADGPGIKMDFGSSQNFGDESIILCHGVDGDGTQFVEQAVSSGSDFANFAVSGLADNKQPTFSIVGIIHANASLASTFRFRWAQNTSLGDALSHKAGSWLRLTKLN